MAAPTVSFDTPSRTKRYVWVQNNYSQDYVEEFRGDLLTIPATGKIKMRYLAAERFLGQPTRPYEDMIRADGSLDGIPKMLKIVEMTEDDQQEASGITKKKFEQEEKQYVESAKTKRAKGGAND